MHFLHQLSKLRFLEMCISVCSAFGTHHILRILEQHYGRQHLMVCVVLRRRYKMQCVWSIWCTMTIISKVHEAVSPLCTIYSRSTKDWSAIYSLINSRMVYIHDSPHLFRMPFIILFHAYNCLYRRI